MLNRVQLFATLWTASCQASLSFPISWSLLTLMSTESVMHATILSTVSHFSFCPQSFPTSGSFPKSRLFASGGQSIAGGTVVQSTSQAIAQRRGNKQNQVFANHLLRKFPIICHTFLCVHPTQQNPIEELISKLKYVWEICL